MSFSPKLLPPPVCAQPFLRLVSQYVSPSCKAAISLFKFWTQLSCSAFSTFSEVLLHLLPPPPTSSFSSLSLIVLFCSLQLPDTLLVSSPIPLPNIPLFLLSLILCSTSPLFSYFLLLFQSLLYEELPPMCQELKIRNIGFT